MRSSTSCHPERLHRGRIRSNLGLGQRGRALGGAGRRLPGGTELLFVQHLANRAVPAATADLLARPARLPDHQPVDMGQLDRCQHIDGPLLLGLSGQLLGSGAEPCQRRNVCRHRLDHAGQAAVIRPAPAGGATARAARSWGHQRGRITSALPLRLAGRRPAAVAPCPSRGERFFPSHRASTQSRCWRNRRSSATPPLWQAVRRAAQGRPAPRRCR